MSAAFQTVLPGGSRLCLFSSVLGDRVAYGEGRTMSIDTLLEAARYLEWQAQQQQITHGKKGVLRWEPVGGLREFTV